VLAVARAAVHAVVLPEPVLALARAAVLAHGILAPVLALPFRSPSLTTAKPTAILGAASTAVSVCVLGGARFARNYVEVLTPKRPLQALHFNGPVASVPKPASVPIV
jgi:hypothetical protein